jgi:hypothetical protein
MNFCVCKSHETRNRSRDERLELILVFVIDAAARHHTILTILPAVSATTRLGLVAVLLLAFETLFVSLFTL